MSGIAELEPPRKQSLDRAAADSLREAIVSGRVAPGSRLTENRLAEQFALSRGTVRAALQRLASEGLVVQRPYAGWDVNTLTAHDVWELATLRASLEAVAGRLAAEAIDESGRAALLEAYGALETAVRGKPEGVVLADLALHRMVVSLSGNARLAHHYDLITNQLRLYIASSNHLAGRDGDILDRHRQLIRPVIEGDLDSAEQAFKAHALVSGQELVAFLKQNEAS